MKAKVAIIGKGNVGGALGRGLERAGYEVQLLGKDASRATEAAAWADVIVLAVPHPAIDAVLAEVGDAISGKVLVDVVNPLRADFQPALGFATSAAEELQRKTPAATVLKAFNTVFAQHMDFGQANGTSLTVFAASDDDAAKTQVLTLIRDIGFDAVDGGALQNARSLEALGFLNIQLGYALGMGPSIGFKLVH